MNKMFIKQILIHSLLPTSTLPQHLSRCVCLFHYSSKYTSRLHPFSCNESSFPTEYDGFARHKVHFSICICNFNLCTIVWKMPAVSLGIPNCSMSKNCRSWQFTSGFKSEREFFIAPEFLLLPIFFSLDMPSLASHGPGQVLSRNNAKGCASLLCNDLYAFLFPVVLPLLHMTILLTQKHINMNLSLVGKIQ